MSATNDVENNISISATFPSSLLNIFEKGSVWYIRKPLEVPAQRYQHQSPETQDDRTNSETAIVLIEGNKVHSHNFVRSCSIAAGVPRSYWTVPRVC